MSFYSTNVLNVISIRDGTEKCHNSGVIHVYTLLEVVKRQIKLANLKMVLKIHSTKSAHMHFYEAKPNCIHVINSESCHTVDFWSIHVTLQMSQKSHTVYMNKPISFAHCFFSATKHKVQRTFLALAFLWKEPSAHSISWDNLYQIKQRTMCHLQLWWKIKIHMGFLKSKSSTEASKDSFSSSPWETCIVGLNRYDTGLISFCRGFNGFLCILHMH